MSKRDVFRSKMAQRIEVAGTRTSALIATATTEKMSYDRHCDLEACRLAIAAAASKLRELETAGDDGTWDLARREMKSAWLVMEHAVRRVTGQPARTAARS